MRDPPVIKDIQGLKDLLVPQVPQVLRVTKVGEVLREMLDQQETQE
jgi:hypothetical protein